MPTTRYRASPREQATGSIASGTAISNTIDLMGYRPAAIVFSSGWNASNMISFKAAASATDTFLGVYDTSGGEYQIASGVLGSATGQAFALGTDLSLALMSRRFMQVQSGPSTAAVNQTTGITFTVHMVPM